MDNLFLILWIIILLFIFSNLLQGLLQNSKYLKYQSFYGFNNKVAKDNENNWKFANKLNGRILTIFSTVEFIIALTLFLVHLLHGFESKTTEYLILAVVLVIDFIFVILRINIVNTQLARFVESNQKNLEE